MMPTWKWVWTLGMAGLRFGHVWISSRIVFYQTHLTFAFTNIKPVVPGQKDVLVSSIRVVPRFEDLTKEEVADLFSCVHTIAPQVQRHFHASSLTISIQDGKDAGQTIPHVHVHVLPRKQGDFTRNDEIYEQLERVDKAHGTLRSEDEMSIEADALKQYFK